MRNGLLSSYHTRISWKSNFWLTFNKWEEWDKEINCDKLTRICFSSALAPQTTVYTIVFHVYVLILSILSSEITFTFFFIWMFKRIGTELIKKIFQNNPNCNTRRRDSRPLNMCVVGMANCLNIQFFKSFWIRSAKFRQSNVTKGTKCYIYVYKIRCGTMSNVSVFWWKTRKDSPLHLCLNILPFRGLLKRRK